MNPILLNIVIFVIGYLLGAWVGEVARRIKEKRKNGK